MTEKPDSPRKPRAKGGTEKTTKDPRWAKGLKKMYDSVVEEPLPDAFMDLLSKLDDGKQ